MTSGRLSFLLWRQEHALRLAHGHGGARLKKAANKSLVKRARQLAQAILENNKANKIGAR